MQLLKQRFRNIVIRARTTWRHAATDSREVWADNLQSEIDWWKSNMTDWLEHPSKNKPAGGIFFRLNPDAELQPEVARFIHSPDAKVLDVGAGPLTVLGKVWDGYRLDITAVDPLAVQYAEMLSSLHVTPPLLTRFAEAESLTQDFKRSTFDLCHARNCLDHSHSPVKAIQEMLAVTKPRGVVFLNHSMNEGAKVSYIGLHQWNFRERGGDFVIASPGKRSVNVSKLLKDLADVSVEIKNGWITVIATKHAAQGAILAPPPQGR